MLQEYIFVARLKLLTRLNATNTSAGRYLVQNRMVDVMVTTAGGIEEDFIKCMGHTYLGDFQLKGTIASIARSRTRAVPCGLVNR